MVIKKQRKALNFLMVLISFAFLISVVSAAGVSSPYYAGNPLYMAPGTTKTVPLTILNTNPNEPHESVSFSAGVTKGSDIASLDQNDYSVAYGDKVDALATITIPENPSVDKYTVEFTFTQKNVASGGQVQLGIAYPMQFDVIVQDNLPQEDTTTVNIGEAPKNRSNLTTILILAGLVVLAIIIYLSSKKGKGKKKK